MHPVPALRTAVPSGMLAVVIKPPWPVHSFKRELRDVACTLMFTAVT